MAMNPFPGVNPYIEAEGYWQDFHRTFINYLREAVLTKLPDGYDATIDEHTLVIDPESKHKLNIPDVAILRTRRPAIDPPDRTRTFVPSSGAVLLEPAPVVVEERREVWIEIRRRVNDDLITSIEVLSPSNKQFPGWEEFRVKRENVLVGGANLVDIDLLVAGRRLRFKQPLPAGEYYAYVTRAAQRPQTEVFSWPLQQRCPMIPIPLASTDPDVQIELQDVFDLAFTRGGYPRRLEYAAVLTTLEPTVANWAAETAAKRPQ